MYTLFFLRTGLQASQRRLTDERVFMPRLWEKKRESGEREVRSTDEGEDKRERRAAKIMAAGG
jgi:hypothetical protein